MTTKFQSYKNALILVFSIVFSSFAPIALAQSLPAPYQQQVATARAQLHSGQAIGAYQSLLSLELPLAGYPAFDLLFGQAALAVHENTRAVLAFERCLMVSPNLGDCRLGLAQAHLRLGEVGAAKDELTYIQKSAPPPAVAKIVEQYLGELSVEQSRTGAFNLWVELAHGYDDNLNVAPSSSSILLPGNSPLAGFTYSTTADTSQFTDVRLGAGYNRPLTQHWDVLMGAQVQGTFNFDAAENSYFDDITQANVHLGTQATYGRQRLGVMAQLQKYRLSGENYRDLLGVTGQYTYKLAATTQLSSFLQYSRLDYAADFMDTSSTTVGASIAHSAVQNRLVLHAGLYLGAEKALESNATPDLNNRFKGLRSGATWFWTQRLQTGLNLMAEQRQYDAGFWMFPDIERQDALLQANLDASYQLTRKLSLNAEYSYVNNNSNLPIRDYDRQIIRFGVHYDFF